MVNKKQPVKKEIVVSGAGFSGSKQAEEALRESEERYREIFDSSDDALVIQDIATGSILDANKTMLKIYGYADKQEALKCTIEDLSALDEGYNKEKILEMNQKAIDSNLNSFEWRAKKKDGEKFWAQVTLKRTRIGGESRIMASIRDITERKRSEEALQESGIRFRELFNHMSSGVAMYEAIDNGGDFIFRDFNTSAEKIEKVSRKDILGKRVSEVFPGVKAFGIFEVFQRVWQTGEPEYFPVHIYLDEKDRGSWRETWVFKLPTGEIVALYNDITERKKAEEALKKSEERHRTLLQTAMDGFWMIDMQGRLMEVNDAYCRMSGYSAQELMAMRVPDLDAAEVADDTAAHIQKVMVQGEDRFKTRHRRKDGSIFDVEISVQYRAYENGSRIVGFLRDISESKQAEEELKKRSAFIENLLENAPIGFAVNTIDDGQRVFVSRNFENIYGVPPGSLHSVADYFEKVYLDPVFREEIRERIMADMATGEAARMRWEGIPITTHAGEHKVVTAINIPLLEQNLMISTVQDVTERKRAEEEKAKLEGQLQQAQKMESVGRLAGGVAHDFNNMLSVILGHAELALEQVDPAQPLHDDLMEIRKAAVRSADLTRQLLAFARKQTVAPKVLDLNETVAGMLKMLQRLIGEDIDLNWQPAADLWPVKVDPSQIDQILANLCVNARDAIADIGRITIETGNSVFDADYCADHAGFEPGEYVLIAVSDNGCGMDKETMSHLFEPFFTTKGVGRGTGLGLATVYGSVKQNNGFINAYSEPGLGTTFKIYLPRHAGKAGQMQNKGQATLAARGHETVLLVEDEPAILKLTKVMLERQGYIVLAASTPGEAIRLSREHAGEIHLLMTDVVMPEMNGRDLAKNLLSLYPDLKRLFMSGYTANVIAHHGVLDEGVYFIQKPFSMEDLAAKVREALDR